MKKKLSHKQNEFKKKKGELLKCCAIICPEGKDTKSQDRSAFIPCLEKKVATNASNTVTFSLTILLDIYLE